MKKNNSKHNDDRLWKNISDGIEEFKNENNRTYLTQAINELPVYVPKETLWKRIENKLDQQNTPVKPLNRNLYFRIAIAASVLIAFGIWYSTLTPGKTERFTYSEEEIMIPQISNSTDTILNQFLEEQCTTLPEKCENPRFTELQDKYQKLEETQESILQTLQDHPGNENMMACIRRIENDKVQLKKQLLKYFES